MFHKIAVIAAGAMGSAVAARLNAYGAKVLTLLDGRSEATRRRAAACGMTPATPEAIADVQVVLSIVPPGEAIRLAETLAPVFARSERRPIYADCNALDVATVKHVGQIIAASNTAFADGAIIGFPPKPDSVGPSFYFAGEPARELAALERLGLRTKVIEGEIGAASALKMAYAGINKGQTGLAAAMVLAAERAGAGLALRGELADSKSELLQRLMVSLPDMYPKAYRWVAEMREIAAFARDDAPVARLYEALADFFEEIAKDYNGERKAVASIDAFLNGQ